MTEEALATTEDVAEYLSMSRKTLDNWRNQGTGPAYLRLPNGSIRYTWPAVREWLGTQTVTTSRGAA